MLTKNEFVTQLAQRAVLSKKQASETLDVFFELLKEAVDRDGKIRFDGVGTFERVVRAARTGRNPGTGAAVQIPARTVVRFTPSAAWKRELNDSEN